MRLIVIFVLLISNILACKEKPSTGSNPSIQDQVSRKTIEFKGGKILSQSEWVKNEGLTNVESVVYDSVLNVFFASCGKNYKPGTDGFITRISGIGEVTELKWLDSLNRPTGMAIYGRKLFVADIVDLVVIDIDKGIILKKYREPIENSGLNDVAISNTGEVFVSASAKHAIYKLKDEMLIEWVSDANRLKWANGILVSEDQLIVGGMNMNAIDMNTGNISKVNYPSNISDIEGVVGDGHGGYYVSTVDNSALWHISKDGKAIELLKDGDYFGDLQFILPNNLVVARGNHDRGEYYLSYIELDIGK